MREGSGVPTGADAAAGSLAPFSVCFGVAVVLITEVFGGVGHLAAWPIGLAWASLIGVLFWLRPTGAVWPAISSLPGVIRQDPLAWGVIIAFLTVTFATGILGAPNVWDGLTYHMPRVERWVEHRHLEFWTTTVDRQLWMSPFSAYAMLQFRLLTGGDRLAFLPSWLAYLGLILLASRIVAQLGGTSRQGALGSLLMATMPVAVLHASSVQTDLLAAFWVLCVATLALDAWRQPAAATDWRNVTWISGATGLAVATKGTALLPLVPWLLLYALVVIREAGWRALIRPLLVGACAVLVLNGAHFARNVAAFGDPLGDASTRAFLRVEPWSINRAMANLLTNVSLHLGTQWAAWNDWIGVALVSIQTSILKVEPAVLYPYFGGFRVQPFSTHESLAGNLGHVVLGVLIALVAMTRRRSSLARPLKAWVIVGVVSFVLYGMLIRWQPYGARLQLVVLVWTAPAMAMLIRGSIARPLTMTILTLMALPFLLGNSLRPLYGDASIVRVPRDMQYFAGDTEVGTGLSELARRMDSEGCRSLGVLAGYDTPEYLVMTGQWRRRLLGLPVQLSQFDTAQRPSSGQSEERPCAGVVLYPPVGVQVVGTGPQFSWIGKNLGFFVVTPEPAQ